MKKVFLLSALLSFGGCAVEGGFKSTQGLISITESHSGYTLCGMSFSKVTLAARSKQIRYEHYKRIVNEIDRRGLDCRSFPDFDHKEDFMRDRIEKFEKDGTW